MCGIAGFVNRSIARDEGDAVLGEMLSRIVHRGPDGEGRLVAAELGLFSGMRRLSIIDLAGGDQPIWNEDRTVAALFNGEIYNYLELAADLKARGHRFATRSDTEVLVHLYEEHGADLVRHLRGMFGFCLFDTRRRRLLLGRDPFGQKPLYFFRGGGVFAFGSEIKALHALPFVDSSLRSGALPDFLAWYGLPPGETHFRNIEKLPAGSTMEVCLAEGPRCAEPKVFWRFEAKAPPDLTEMDDAAEALDAALDESASVHLRADVPVGVLLSSGLDSKVILTYAKRRAQDQLAAFSVGFRGAGRESELPGARETARSLGVRHECIEVGAEDLADSVEEIAWHLDEPVGDHACFAVRAVCRLAKQSVKVLLSGEGADELFGGYEERYLGRLDTMERSDRLRRWRTLLPRTATPFPAGRFGRLCQRAHLGEAAEMASLRANGFPFDRRAPMGFTPDQLQRFAARIEEVGARVVRPQRDRLHSWLALNADWDLAESLLQKADKMSMAASIELRTPFLDREVAAVASRIASPLKLDPERRVGKVVLRRCLARRDASEDDARPKRGFPVPIGTWLRGDLKARAEADLFGANPAWAEELDRQLVRSAWDAFQRGEIDGAGQFFALWLYENWRRALRTRASA